MKRFFKRGRTESKAGKSDRRQQPQRAAAGRRFHAVTIQYSEGTACEAVRAVKGHPFLSAEAPILPLSECALSGSCRCHYRHQDDRRTQLRRDTDHGLPDRFYAGEDRRGSRADRRLAR